MFFSLLYFVSALDTKACVFSSPLSFLPRVPPAAHSLLARRAPCGSVPYWRPAIERRQLARVSARRCSWSAGWAHLHAAGHAWAPAFQQEQPQLPSWFVHIEPESGAPKTRGVTLTTRISGGRTALLLSEGSFSNSRCFMSLPYPSPSLHPWRGTQSCLCR